MTSLLDIGFERNFRYFHLESELAPLINESEAGIRFGVKLIYVKGLLELSRSKDELRCKVVAVTSRLTPTGVIGQGQGDTRNPHLNPKASC